MIVYLGAKTLPESMIKEMNDKHDARLLSELRAKVLRHTEGARLALGIITVKEWVNRATANWLLEKYGREIYVPFIQKEEQKMRNKSARNLMDNARLNVERAMGVPEELLGGNSSADMKVCRGPRTTEEIDELIKEKKKTDCSLNVRVRPPESLFGKRR